jgi:hypothetical protein
MPVLFCDAPESSQIPPFPVLKVRIPLKKFALFLVCAALLSVPAFAQATPYVDAADAPGFDTSIIAAINKKGTPVSVIMDKAQAQYVLHASSVTTHQESGAGKIARCLFAYCVGIEDSANVSVSLLDNSSQKVLWAYDVGKQSGNHNRQSMAEAIAKHLKKYLEGKET